ncbi:MAG: lipopolysaccharide heptosyltransferase II [Capsulimonadaceae bacterium]
MPSAVPPLSEIDRLLVVKTSSIGDVVHATPIVEAIRRAKPDITIDWLVRRRCADIVRGNPHVGTVHVVENKVSLAELSRLRQALRACRYQCALDMQGLFLSGLYTLLSGAPVRIGLDRDREKNTLFLTHPVVPGQPAGAGQRDRHAVDILLGFAEVLGIAATHPEFSPQAYLASDPPEDLIRSINALPRPRVALNTGASTANKQWPDDHWRALAELLSAAGAGLVFVGSAQDATVVQRIRSALKPSPDVVDTAGKTSLRELAAVLASCDVVVSADTGPMHIAVAVGTPVIALFGATNPDRSGPYGGRNVVLDMHLSCSPCYRNPTCHGRIDCMRAIEPAAVLEAVLKAGNRR